MGGDTTPNRAVVRRRRALEAKAKSLHGEFSRGGDFQHLLLPLHSADHANLANPQFGNRLPTVEQDSAAGCDDPNRTHSDELQMTQEFIRTGWVCVAKADPRSSKLAGERGMIS